MAKPSSFLKKVKSLVLVSSVSVGVFSGVSYYKGSEKYYDNFLMPVLQQFSPEFGHVIGISACKYNLIPKSSYTDPHILNTTFLGHKLSNPVGIAAGFDKQGEAVIGLQRLGFGFIEIGSVTPEPQSGNPKPRVFRLIEDKAVINRYGFNSDGHTVVFKRLFELRRSGKFNGMLGINLGKNKTSQNPVLDYVEGVNLFGPICDYLVINISSPNTPGLRSMQSKQELEQLLRPVIKSRNDLPNHPTPVLLKLAPDLNDAELKDIAQVIRKSDCKVDGLIISNTTVERENLKSPNKVEVGGLSGAPLTEKSVKVIAKMYKLTNGEVPIVGVGGIFNGQDAYNKILAGASVVQIYSSFAMHGPPVVTKIKSELDELLKKDGYKNIAEAVGKEYKKFL